MVNSPRYEQLKRVLRTIRNEAGLTQAELARRLGKKQAYVSKIELGERHLAFMDFLEWCEACGVAPADIIKKL